MVLKTTCSWSLLMCWWWICFVDSFSILVFLYVFWKFRVKPHLEDLFYFPLFPLLSFLLPTPHPRSPWPRSRSPKEQQWPCLGGPAWEGLPGRGRDATAETASGWAPHPVQVVLVADGEFPVGRRSQPLTRIPWGAARAKVSSAQNSGPTYQSHSGRAGESRWPDAGSSNCFYKRLDSTYFLLHRPWGSL